MISLPDAMRAQYFIGILDRFVSLLKNNSLGMATDYQTGIIDDLYRQIAERVDQIVLPVIAFEIASAKERGFLSGRTSADRYDSFFVHNKKWTDNARSLIGRYPKLFEMVEVYIKSSVQNIMDCLLALLGDRDALMKKFKIQLSDAVSEIIILDADRHRGGKQPVLLGFASGKKLIFKPRSVDMENIFRYIYKIISFKISKKYF